MKKTLIVILAALSGPAVEGLNNAQTTQAVQVIPLAAYSQGQSMLQQAIAQMKLEVKYSFLDKEYEDDKYVRDPVTGHPIVETILDEAEQKGTGRWTVVTAFELGVPAPSITAAVDARVVSSRRTERLAASGAIQGPAAREGLARDLAPAVRDALLVARIAAFAQGMDLLRAGSAEYGWEIEPAEAARVWTGGCIIRSRLLDPIRRAFLARPDLPNLLLDPEIGGRLEAAQAGPRRALGEAQARGIPAPVWSSALAWLDGFRTARLPQSLTQAQRDYFGGHGFRLLERPDAPPTHADWATVAGTREAP